MLIPSIDLEGGRIVQLQQGERLVLASDDIDGWLAQFSRYPIVQLIDLDAAKRTGSNRALVESICAVRPCQVGGGVRTPQDAAALIAAGAAAVIVGSALFANDTVNVDTAIAIASAVGRERFIAAVDARHGRVAVDGWRTVTALDTPAAMRALEPHVAGFLATLIEGEGLLGGIDLATVRSLRSHTARRLIAAGGIRSHSEVAALDAMGADAIVGMAIYTGMMPLDV